MQGPSPNKRDVVFPRARPARWPRQPLSAQDEVGTIIHRHAFHAAGIPRWGKDRCLECDPPRSTVAPWCVQATALGPLCCSHLDAGLRPARGIDHGPKVVTFMGNGWMVRCRSRNSAEQPDCKQDPPHQEMMLRSPVESTASNGRKQKATCLLSDPHDHLGRVVPPRRIPQHLDRDRHRHDDRRRNPVSFMHPAIANDVPNDHWRCR